MRRLLLLASEAYSPPILAPVADAAAARGDAVAWLARDAVAATLPAGARRLRSAHELEAFAAEATLATVHRIPPQLPGVRVQLFHGLNTDKRDAARGHFKVRGLFHLYCTHGPATTGPFQALAATHGDFAVAETGWPKLDPLFAGARPGAHALRARASGRPVVMLASTFTERLSAARDLLPLLRDWTARGDRHWLLTLHPKSDPALIEAYRALEGPHAQVLGPERLIDMLAACDALVCDTSSVIDEAVLLGTPVVTVRTRVPHAHLLDVRDAAQVDAMLEVALRRPADLLAAMAAHADAIHPLRDGHAAPRVLDALDAFIARDAARLRPLPFNAWRRWRARGAMAALLPG